MNEPKPSSTEALRSDIDHTRRRMDDTMEALADRLQPQHLVDEFLGFLRRPGENGESHLTELREKITESADTAMHAVVDTVKKNPLPALLIGAGIAWMIYGRRREPEFPAPDGDYYGYDRDGDPAYDPDIYQDRPLQYPTDSSGDGGHSKLGELKHTIANKASHAAHQAKEKMSHAGEAAKEKIARVGEVAREKAANLGERASEKFQDLKAGTSRAYDRTRERVVTTADQHPLEVGLACLATGVIAGLALPTPGPINRRLGPAAERLRERTLDAGRDMMAKGRQVAQAAVGAAKEEAKAQGLPGLTPESNGSDSDAPEASSRDTSSSVQQASQSGP
jgi:hypothetical protein